MLLIKVDSKSLGIVQIMIGVVILPFGIILKDSDILGIRSGIMFWGSLCFVITGCLSAAVVDYRNSSLVKSSLLANLISTVAGILATIFFSVDLWHMDNTMQECSSAKCVSFEHIIMLIVRPIFRLFLVFSLLEIFMAIWSFILLWKSRNSPEAMLTP